MTTPNSATQARGAALVAKDPSLLHQHLAEYASMATDLHIDPKHVQIVLGLHHEFQKSQAWKDVQAADRKARQDAAKKAVRAKRTDKVKAVTDAVVDDEGRTRPDDSHLQYKVWTDTPVESEHGMVWAMLEVKPLTEGGHEYEVVERVMDAADLQIHRKGCADVAKFKKQKGSYHVRTVRAHDPIHAAYVEISEVNQSDGVGAMGYDIDNVNILPCAHEATLKPRPVRRASQTMKNGAGRARAARTAKVDTVTPDQAEAIALETGASKEEAEAAAIEQEHLNEQAAKPVRKASPRVRRAVKKAS